MITKMCPKHKCVVTMGKCTEFDIDKKTGKRVSCDADLEEVSAIFWCEKCNVPSYYSVCPKCKENLVYLCTDIRPVFPEEKILYAILKKKNPDFYQKSSMWCSSNTYIIDGKKEKFSVTSFNRLSLEEIKKIKDEYENNKNLVNYEYFNQLIKRFCEVNQTRYDEITDEAISYIQGFKKDFELDSMFVSFSGGKDSTVVSSLVTRAFSSNKVIHIFGDTTLEFPLTYEYKKRFAKEHMVVTAKNYEKSFENLCEQIGPPSRVMRWCCTVFKTGAITPKLASVFKDKTKVLSFQGIRHSESVSRSKYERESEDSKIAKQTAAMPIINWIDFDVWLYILETGIDFNEAYRLGYSRVGCWCCPNNGGWSEFLSKVHMFEQYTHWRELLIKFANQIGKPDPEEYIDGGFWKARQGGNGLEFSKKSIVSFTPCATADNAFNYELQRPITEEFYELFKPFGYINKELGNKRLGEVYVIDKKGNPVLILQGKEGSTKLKVTIKKTNLAKAKTLAIAETRVQCQLTKYQMCLGCKACESVCKHNAISMREKPDGTIEYRISDEKCVRCTECVAHFGMGCYMRKVLTIKRT